MTGYELQLAAHNATFAELVRVKGLKRAAAAARFGQRQGLMLSHYKPEKDLVYLADGEPYSWEVILPAAEKTPGQLE